MKTETLAGSTTDEAGFGLIEIMVSMFLLALLAVFFLPTLIESMRITVTNSTTVTASQLVSAQLDVLRTLNPDCDSVSAFDDMAFPASTDARGTVFQPHALVGSCPVAYPGVVEVTVWVTEQGDSTRIADAITKVMLTSQTAVGP